MTRQLKEWEKRLGDFVYKYVETGKIGDLFILVEDAIKQERILWNRKLRDQRDPK